jgi:hypothetical protein
MMRDHSLIEELSAVDALGGIDGDDRELLERQRASHGDCAECRAIEAGFAEAAGSLAATLTPLPVDEGMADVILDRARQAPPPAPTDATGEPEDELAERRSRSPRFVLGLAAAAVVAVLAIVAANAISPPVTGIEEATPSQRIVRFEGAVDGALAMAYTPGETGAVFVGSGLPDPGDGRVYEIWMIDEGEVVSGGCVVPADGVVALRVDANIGTTDTMAVTAESADCPAAPTTDPLLLADLTVV